MNVQEDLLRAVRGRDGVQAGDGLLDGEGRHAAGDQPAHARSVAGSPTWKEGAFTTWYRTRAGTPSASSACCVLSPLLTR